LLAYFELESFKWAWKVDSTGIHVVADCEKKKGERTRTRTREERAIRRAPGYIRCV
jgi:hypothetical protein